MGKIGLVGPGAIGGYYGGMLANAGQDIHFLFRSTYEDVRREGLTLIHHAKEGKRNKIEPLKAYQEAESLGPCDWIIVAAKTTANPFLGDLIKPMVAPATRFITLQNGMGNVENLLHFFGNDRLVIAGLCFTCINRTSAGVIESLLPGYVQFGQLGEQLSTEHREWSMPLSMQV